MPQIRTVSEFKNNFNDISKIIHEMPEPLFLTEDGQDDMVLMSNEVYNKLSGKYLLYDLLNEGLEAEKAGNVFLIDQTFDEILAELEE